MVSGPSRKLCSIQKLLASESCWRGARLQSIAARGALLFRWELTILQARMKRFPATVGPLCYGCM